MAKKKQTTKCKSREVGYFHNSFQYASPQERFTTMSTGNKHCLKKGFNMFQKPKRKTSFLVKKRSGAEFGTSKDKSCRHRSGRNFNL